MYSNQVPGEPSSVLGAQARSFDVVCVGAPRWQAARPEVSLANDPRLRLRGAVSVAAALAVDGLRVALASVLPDDTRGRPLLAGLTARGVDVDAVELAAPSRGLVFVKGGARQDLSFGYVVRPIEVPSTWSSQVLLLSGVSPFVAHSAALCKVARAARRAGALVIVDVNADWHVWQGHDSRTVRMLLREADVVWCSAADLFGINMDLPTLRAALGDAAVLVLHDGASTVTARGPFGEVSVAAAPSSSLMLDHDDAFVTAICAELARGPGGRGDAFWAGALRHGQAAVLRRQRT